MFSDFFNNDLSAKKYSSCITSSMIFNCEEVEFKKEFNDVFKMTQFEDENIFDEVNIIPDLDKEEKILTDVKYNTTTNNDTKGNLKKKYKKEKSSKKKIFGGKGNKKLKKLSEKSIISKVLRTEFLVMKKKENRVDYLKKNFKIQSNKCLLRQLNSLLDECFPDRKLKFLKLNSLAFTSKTERKINLKFFDMKIKEILTIGINTQKKINNQKENLKLLNQIEPLIKEADIDTPKYELKRLINMTLENFYIHNFYNSKEYEEFCTDENNVDNHSEFEKVNGYSLRKKSDYGFIRYIRSY